MEIDYTTLQIIIGIITSLMIACATLAMMWNAMRLKKIQESNQKMAMWPHILSAFDGFNDLFDFTIENKNKGFNLESIKSALKKFQFFLFYLDNDDELFLAIEKQFGLFNEYILYQATKDSEQPLKTVTLNDLFDGNRNVDNILKKKYGFTK